MDCIYSNNHPKEGTEYLLPLRMMVYSKLLPRSIYKITQVVTFIEEFHLSKTLIHQVDNKVKINNHPQLLFNDLRL